MMTMKLNRKIIEMFGLFQLFDCNVDNEEERFEQNNGG